MSTALSRAGAAYSFDAEYYVGCYREEVPADMPPLEHFLTEGVDLGFKPNKAFDPLVRRLRDPTLDRDGLLSAFVEAGPNPPEEPRIGALLPSIRTLECFRPPRTVPPDDDINAMSARTFAEPSEVRFEAAGRPYLLTAPAAGAFLDRLRADLPFACARVTHGDFDCLHAYEHYRGEMRRIGPAGLSPDCLDRLALRYCDEILHDEQIYAENFLFELLRDLEQTRRNPAFLRSVAFKGYPTADNRLFEWSADDALHETDIDKLAIFSRYYEPDEPLYDATLWKRWVVSGALDGLPELARERPVVFLGANRVGDLDRRWRLPWFVRVEAPSRFGYSRRYELLDACRESLAAAKAFARAHGTRRPLFLLQGSSFATWFIVRLFATDPDVFYFDLGQALHAWFFDRGDIERMNWGRVFGPATVSSPGIREYYRDLGFAEPEALFLGPRG